MNRRQPHKRTVTAFVEMVQIAARIMAAGVAVAMLRERPRILDMLLVVDVDKREPLLVVGAGLGCDFMKDVKPSLACIAGGSKYRAAG